MDAFLVKYGAPTLAGLKTGSLFNLPCRSRRELGEAVARGNRRLNPKGLYVAVLRQDRDSALILLYRRQELETDLCQREAAALLCQLGYREVSLGGRLQELRRRLAERGDFPHEIGLFLGYPPEDVRGFMADCRGHNCKCSGCWKVYGDEAAARDQFRRYKQCTAIYCSLYRRGKSLTQLAVSA